MTSAISMSLHCGRNLHVRYSSCIGHYTRCGARSNHLSDSERISADEVRERDMPAITVLLPYRRLCRVKSSCSVFDAC